jgi:hypothetical protein
MLTFSLAAAPRYKAVQPAKVQACVVVVTPAAAPQAKATPSGSNLELARKEPSARVTLLAQGLIKLSERAP